MNRNLFTNEILYCIDITKEDDFDYSFLLASHFGTKNDYIFNCFTYYCPIYRSFTEMPMLFDLIKEIPFDKRTEENSNIYDAAFINSYDEGLTAFINTEKAYKELIYKTAMKPFWGFYIDERIYGSEFFNLIGNDAGKRYKAWEIITQTPDEFADYFDKPEATEQPETINPIEKIEKSDASTCIIQLNTKEENFKPTDVYDFWLSMNDNIFSGYTIDQFNGYVKSCNFNIYKNGKRNELKYTIFVLSKIINNEWGEKTAKETFNCTLKECGKRTHKGLRKKFGSIIAKR